MASGFGETTSHNGDGDGASNFECNICLDLAQDPIVTLCGHLFCWPCLYKWLSLHSHSQQCPVCKAFVQVDKLVPLYGRGKSSSDPRSKSIPGIHIPDRPSGQRPETAPSPAAAPQTNHFHQHGFGVMGGWGGFAPVITARFANFPLSVAFGGVIPSFLNFQRHGFANAAMYGTNTGYHHQPYGYGNPYHGVHPRVHQRYPGHGQQDNYLMMLLLVIAVLVLLTLATT